MKLLIFAIAATSVAAFQSGLPKKKTEIPKFLSQAVQAGALVGAIAFGAIDPAFAGDVGAGQQIFGANCAACHAGGKNVIAPKKTLEKDALDQYLVGGRSEESIVTLVKNGKNAMPAFSGRLDNDQTSDVAIYIISQSEAGWDE